MRAGSLYSRRGSRQLGAGDGAGRLSAHPLQRAGLDTENDGGEGGIRTPDTLSGISVFKTDCFNRSHTSPRRGLSKVYQRPAAAHIRPARRFVI